MPAYITRWGCGDFSITVKPNKKTAVHTFDPLELYPEEVARISDCTLHFTLTPEGQFVLDFNETSETTVMAILDLYPHIRDAVVRDNRCDLTDPQLPEKFAAGAKQELQDAADDLKASDEQIKRNLEEAWSRSAKH